MQIDVPNSRQDFNESWLSESPEGIGYTDLKDMIEYNIKDLITHGANVIDLGNNLKKIQGQQTVYYWYEKNSKILLGAEFSIKPQTLVVNAIGKFHKGHPPYASALYSEVLKDQGKSIRILSDTQLSDEGFNIWKRLLADGHQISVYDVQNPGQTFIEIKSIEELQNYFKHDDTNFRRYQYVISENKMYFETRSYFNTRRLRELSGLSLL